MSPRLPPKKAAQIPNESNHKSKTQLSRTERPVSEQTSGSFIQEIGKDVLFGREGTKNSRTGRLVDGPPSIQSCVPVFVELVDKDDAYENVGADQTRTVRPVSGQSLIQLEEIDTDFRVPGLSHAVVKEAENLRSRVRKVDRKSSSSRGTSSRRAAE